MGRAQVERVRHNGRAAIRKGPLASAEAHFYRDLVTHPAYQGPAVPEVLGWEDDAILLERIPGTLAANDTLDRTLMEPLTLLHRSRLPVEADRLFQFRWQQDDLEPALHYFPKQQQTDLERRLKPFYAAADTLLEPQVLISGDTNHGNWGRRDSGEAVLFDWERLGRGSPAIDLAPMIPGLAAEPEVRDYVRLYRSCWTGCPFSEDSLVRQVLQSMALIALEVVNILHHRANPEARRYQDWFDRRYLRWLDSISSSMRSLRSHS